MLSSKYNVARFVAAIEQERHPIMLTAMEMKIISQALLGIREFIKNQLEYLESDEYFEAEGEDEVLDQPQMSKDDKIKYVKCQMQHINHMASLLAGFAHDIKEKAEAKYDIEV